MTKLGFRSILTTEIVWIVSAISMASAMWIVSAALVLLFNKYCHDNLRGYLSIM